MLKETNDALKEHDVERAYPENERRELGKYLSGFNFF